MFKSASLALLAFVAAATSVSAQTGLPNRTYFTNPLDMTPPLVYNTGDEVYFSWNKACVAPSEYTAANPKAAQVQLINSSNSTNAFFVADVTTIDCTAEQGNTKWTVPTDKIDPNAFYSLQIILSQPVYSGRFKIAVKGAAPPQTSAGAGDKTGSTSAASGMTASMAISGAALAASAAWMLL
ncbi:hypothetical protein EMPS_06482 [Entomortierella parvispora]|uniref:Uncharacterized protein n=1 Tax=Entomortierella parvispora TaxID=205924 RepID=A0A9P3LXH3_9FUNG|nr:hypothetical protein EMPS_06482 [Entomortierella parvispora]